MHRQYFTKNRTLPYPIYTIIFVTYICTGEFLTDETLEHKVIQLKKEAWINSLLFQIYKTLQSNEDIASVHQQFGK